MEYIYTNNLNFAEQCLIKSYEICSSDPLILNEMGVIAYQKLNYLNAVNLFLQALKLVNDDAMSNWQITLYNTAQSLRKLKKYDMALTYYKRARSVCNNSYDYNDKNNISSSLLQIWSIDTSIGFTYHLMNQIDLAIEYYHKALSKQPQDTFTLDLLRIAFEEI